MFSFSEIDAADAIDDRRRALPADPEPQRERDPGVAKLEGPQAAAFFMLGETTGTAAGGKDEEGKFLRVPGTNPFFPMHHDHQGNRFLELLERNPIEVYIMNTGRVGGRRACAGSKKVRIPHSSAIVKAIAEGTIEWEADPDFGYQVARSVPGIDASDIDLLQPRRLYEATGRGRRVRRAGGAAQGRAGRVPGPVPEPVGGDRGLGRVAERLPPSETKVEVQRTARGFETTVNEHDTARQRDSFSDEFAERDNDLGPLLAQTTRAELIGTVATRTLLQLHLERRRHQRGGAAVARLRRRLADPRLPRVHAPAGHLT